MSTRGWSVADMPDLTGMTAVVTGANRGIGLEVARGLAGQGARVVLAVRRPGRGEAADPQQARPAPPAAVPGTCRYPLGLDTGARFAVRGLRHGRLLGFSGHPELATGTWAITFTLSPESVPAQGLGPAPEGTCDPNGRAALAFATWPRPGVGETGQAGSAQQTWAT